MQNIDVGINDDSSTTDITVVVIVSTTVIVGLVSSVIMNKRLAVLPRNYMRCSMLTKQH